LFFILLNPENDPETHLLMLADVAKIASDPEVVESILEAATTDEVLTQLKSLENLSTGSTKKVGTESN
jgi:mannitol/fructose-specific phosphotransferase system IIA component (Ntr-type)